MVEAARREDKWNAGDAYEPYVGRWSRLVAAEFVDWLAVGRGARWLDVGCGTGALTRTILERAAPRQVIGVDASEAFLGFARGSIRDARVELRIGDARALPVDEAGFDVAVAGLLLNFVPEPAKALAEMFRAVCPGGVVSVYVWDYAGEMQLMRRFWDAAVALDPVARDLDEGRRFPICSLEGLGALCAEIGLCEIRSRTIDVPTVFRDFDDCWSPFLVARDRRPATALHSRTPSAKRSDKSFRVRCRPRPTAAFTSRRARSPFVVPGRNDVLSSPKAATQRGGELLTSFAPRPNFAFMSQLRATTTTTATRLGGPCGVGMR